MRKAKEQFSKSGTTSPIILIFPSKKGDGWVGPIAAVERAHSYRARSGSTGLTQRPLHPSSFTTCNILFSISLQLHRPMPGTDSNSPIRPWTSAGDVAQCLIMKHQEGSDSFLGCEIGPEDSKPFEELAIRMAGMKNRWGVRFRRYWSPASIYVPC